MKDKKRPPRKGDRILGPYRKVGTKFVPPMLQDFQFDYIKWSSHTMPELIWWDVIADRVSHRFAAKVAEEIGKYFKGRGDKNHWWAFISDYGQLSGEDFDGLRRHLAQSAVLSLLTGSLSDFLDLYPECPLAKLSDSRPTGIVDVGYLSRFENRMRELEDKRSRNGVLMQAQAVYLAFMLERLYVKKGLALADFPEVQHYPQTEKSEAVGASVCAAVNMLAGRSLPKYIDDTWVQYFWRRSVDLRPLDFRHLSGDDERRE